MKKQLSLALSVLLLVSSMSLECAKTNAPAGQTGTGIVTTCKNAVTKACKDVVNSVKSHKKVAVAVAVVAVATGAVVVAYKKSSWFRELLGVEAKKQPARFVY